MSVYHKTIKELSGKKFEEIKIHLSKRLKEEFDDEDVLCLLVECYHTRNKEAIELSNK